MADKNYIEETFVFYLEMWDGEVSATKPTVRPHSAWLEEADVAEITATWQRGSGDAAVVLETKTLTDDEVEYTGTVGRWRVRFDTSDTPGRHYCIFDADTIDSARQTSAPYVKAYDRP